MPVLVAVSGNCGGEDCLGFNTDRPSPLEKPRGEERLAIEYLRQGSDAQVFLLLSSPCMEKDPSARFALGLCHLRAGEQDAAIFARGFQNLRGTWFCWP